MDDFKTWIDLKKEIAIARHTLNEERSDVLQEHNKCRDERLLSLKMQKNHIKEKEAVGEHGRFMVLNILSRGTNPLLPTLNVNRRLNSRSDDPNFTLFWTKSNP